MGHKKREAARARRGSQSYGDKNTELGEYTTGPARIKPPDVRRLVDGLGIFHYLVHLGGCRWLYDREGGSPIVIPVSMAAAINESLQCACEQCMAAVCSP